jgi:hypothetical protein
LIDKTTYVEIRSLEEDSMLGYVIVGSVSVG